MRLVGRRCREYHAASTIVVYLRLLKHLRVRWLESYCGEDYRARPGAFLVSASQFGSYAGTHNSVRYHHHCPERCGRSIHLVSLFSPADYSRWLF